MDEPISKNDPDGRFVWGAIIGATVDYGLQVANNIIQDGFSVKSFTNVKVSSIFISGVAGLASGGVSSLTKMANLSKVLKAGINVAANSGLSILEGYTKVRFPDLIMELKMHCEMELLEGLPVAQVKLFIYETPADWKE